jgi:hypothetical protein
VLESGETKAILYNKYEKSYELSEIFECENSMELSGEYEFRKIERFVIGEMKSYNEKLNEDFSKILLSDWKDLIGVGISGSGEYKKSFIRPKMLKEKLVLDLGKVNYSCETFLNGESLGVKIMPPYRYEIPSSKVKDVNELTIRVTNSVANEFTTTKSFDKWSKWQMSVYHDKMSTFEKETVSGGLFGPVVISY